MKEINWKEVLDCKINYGHIGNMIELAKKVGYEYILWNDRVYDINNNEFLDYEIDYFLKNFNWKKFINGKIVVHCDTEEKAIDFLKQCHDRGMTWCNGDIILSKNNEWNIFKENTCYEYDYGVAYGSLDCYKKDNCKIIKWEIEVY